LSIVPGIGPRPAKWCLISDSPNQEDSNKRRPFSGRSGKELDRFFDDYHIPARNKWWTTFLHKSLIDDKRPPSAQEVAEHQAWLLDELREVRPRVIVLMGKRTLAWFLGTAHDINDYHGISAPMPVAHPAHAIVPNAVLFPCVSPGHAFISPEFFRKFVMDMGRLELLTKGQLPPQPVDDGAGDYRLLRGADVAELLV
jgi:uracil-DNA glycosylase family 4